MGLWGGTEAALVGFSSLAHGRFPFSAESPQRRTKSQCKGHPGAQPLCSHTHGHLQNHMCHSQPHKYSQRGTGVHTHAHVCAGTHTWGTKGTGRGWAGLVWLPVGNPTLGGLWEGMPGWVLGKGHNGG